MAWFSVVITTLTILSLSTNPTFSTPVSVPIPIQFPDDNFTGDAHVVGDIQLSQPTPPSFEIIELSDPFYCTSSISLSVDLTFETDDDIALVIIPFKLPTNKSSFALFHASHFLGVQVYANVCKIWSPTFSKISKINNVLEDGVNLSTWIDYRAISKRLDVSVGKSGDLKSVEPLISYYGVDLGGIFKGEEVILGLASSNETNEYSYHLLIKDFLNQWWCSVCSTHGFSLHQHPMPAFPYKHSTWKTFKGIGGFLIISELIYTAAGGCGLSTAFVVLFVWSCVVDWQGKLLLVPNMKRLLTCFK